METPMPGTLRAVVTLRVGEPLGRGRGGTKERFEFVVSEGYAVLRQQCVQRLDDVAAVLRTANRPALRLSTDSNLYFKRAKNDPQDRYVRLSGPNFVSSIHHRWCRHRQSTSSADDLKFEFFLYVETEPTGSLQRATRGRIESANLRRQAHEAANQVAFGAITGHHLDVVNARQADGNPFLVPTDNTTQQAMQLDRLRDVEATAAAQQPIQEAFVNIKLNGVWMRVEIELASLRTALRLPQHDIFTEGIYHGFSQEAPTHGDQVDVDHEEE